MSKISKEAVNYRKGDDKTHCGNCVMYHPAPEICDLVSGIILSTRVCDRWESKKKHG